MALAPAIYHLQAGGGVDTLSMLMMLDEKMRTSYIVGSLSSMNSHIIWKVSKHTRKEASWTTVPLSWYCESQTFGAESRSSFLVEVQNSCYYNGMIDSRMDRHPFHRILKHRTNIRLST